MIQNGHNYKPAIVFENPRRITEAASKLKIWEPVVHENLNEEAVANTVPDEISLKSSR